MNVRTRLIDIHYEDGPWPRWRLDQTLRYQLRSVLHANLVPTDMVHHARSCAYLDRFRNRMRESIAHGTARTLRIAAAGDWMWTPKPHDLSAALVAQLGDADLRIFNLETPIDPSRPVPRHAVVRYNANPDLLDYWQPPALVSLVNNHALDQGLAGLASSRDQVARNHTCVGGMKAEHAAATLQVREVNVGAIACTYGVNPWAHRGDAVPPGVPCIHFGSKLHPTPWREVEALLAQIRTCDLRVVLAHWGSEYAYWPSNALRADAYRLLELGADLVIGSSPHVVQPVEVVSINHWDEDAPIQLHGAGKPRPGVIAFSLGNFVSAMPTTACTVGGLLDVRFAWTADGATNLTGLDVYGTLSARNRDRGQSMLMREVSPTEQCKATPHLARLSGKYVAR
jgi:poly-gamma-glutamate capsule biosynthesis protein CapA/YwtB (metallophosphatase superfamily)